MGVSGLWDVLRPAKRTHSLSRLAITQGFERNVNGHRGFRIGIDVSIWLFHTRVFHGKPSRAALGENPELRLLFFKCARFLHLPLLPLFVFDGDKGPAIKRGKPVFRERSPPLVEAMKNVIRAFGYEYHLAPGEADAELAYLNMVGVIDAVMSDDVDLFLFGATTIIRNPSPTLSGNRANPVKNSEGKQDGNHVHVYAATDLVTRSGIRLTRGGLILVGLMSGSDYLPAGVPGIGINIARGLAECGFGDQLVEAVRTLRGEVLERYLARWRADIVQELRTNSRHIMGRKHPSAATAFPADFPDLEVLDAYINPVISATKGDFEGIEVDWCREPDPILLAQLCEQYFDWGGIEMILKRFERLVWPGIACRILRHSVILADVASLQSQGAIRARASVPRAGVASGQPAEMVAQDSSQRDIKPPAAEPLDAPDAGPLILQIVGERSHVSTDRLREFRLEVAPPQLAEFARQGVLGTRGNMNDGPGRHVHPCGAPDKALRVWMPACMVELARPSLVRDYEAAQERKQRTRGKDINGQRLPNAISGATSAATSNHLSARDAPVPDQLHCRSSVACPSPSTPTASSSTGSALAHTHAAVESQSTIRPGPPSPAQPIMFFSDDEEAPLPAAPRKPRKPCKPRTQANRDPGRASRTMLRKKRPHLSPCSSDNETQVSRNMRKASDSSLSDALRKSPRKSKLQTSPHVDGPGVHLRYSRSVTASRDYASLAVPESRSPAASSEFGMKSPPGDLEVIIISSSEDECFAPMGPSVKCAPDVIDLT